MFKCERCGQQKVGGYIICEDCDNTTEELVELVKEMIACLNPNFIEAHDEGGLMAMGYTHTDDCSICKARRIISKATQKHDRKMKECQCKQCSGMDEY